MVYDILGREVTTLVNQKQKPGIYEINFDASKYSSGVYYYQLKVGAFIKTIKTNALWKLRMNKN
ncbi:MAG: T9SS type A sorting domain-containing protein [Ignavibacteriales bacterium]|nr:T9SS type A sorting domain-containing protein [Ignavibacteriales bacterium]